MIHAAAPLDIMGSLVAIGIFAGPAHILIAGNDAFWAMVDRAAVGRPMRETYIDPLWSAVHAAMDAVLMDGQPRKLQLPSGPLSLCRLADVRGRPGIGSRFELTRHGSRRSHSAGLPAHEQAGAR